MFQCHNNRNGPTTIFHHGSHIHSTRSSCHYRWIPSTSHYPFLTEVRIARSLGLGLRCVSSLVHPPPLALSLSTLFSTHTGTCLTHLYLLFFVFKPSFLLPLFSPRYFLRDNRSSQKLSPLTSTRSRTLSVFSGGIHLASNSLGKPNEIVSSASCL